MPSKINRQFVASLSISGAALVGIALNEGYSPVAYIPVKGDVPTIEYGKTAGVKLGDTTTPTRALVDLLTETTKVATEIKKCVKVPLTQYEFDAYESFAYNVGTSAFCSSSLLVKLNSGDYSGACDELLKWDKFHGKVLPGLTARRQREWRTCKGV